MKATLGDRLLHIKQAIAHIHGITGAWTDSGISSDPIRRAALERFFEIISEASRYIPDDMRSGSPTFPGSISGTSATSCVMAMTR